jgi:3'(2'), 5'-bisphosphate nucleotidase
MEWDTAAMQIIVEEAGGVVCRPDGTPMRYNKTVPDNPNGFVVMNRRENLSLAAEN